MQHINIHYITYCLQISKQNILVFQTDVLSENHGRTALVP